MMHATPAEVPFTHSPAPAASLLRSTRCGHPPEHPRRLGLPQLKIGARVPTDVLSHLVEVAAELRAQRSKPARLGALRRGETIP